MIERYLKNEIQNALTDRMAFISGARQVGKTTLANRIGEQFFKGRQAYFNWDSGKDRKAVLSEKFPADAEYVILDEVHKFRKWKNLIKGVFDKNRNRFKIIVTGSARLDIFRKGGDSLLGRYRHFRLHPLSLPELGGGKCAIIPGMKPKFPPVPAAVSAGFSALLKYGGFPEVFSRKNGAFLRQWHNERKNLLVKEDIRDIEGIRDLSTLQVLADMLPGKVGSLLSLNSLREDLEVAYNTVADWMEVLERFYFHYRIYPFHSKLFRALKKEPKLYLWDWSEVPEPAARFENFIASHLLKFCDYFYDTQGYRTRLHYLRDRQQREVDFFVTYEGKPWFAVEVKTGVGKISTPLRYFTDRLKIPCSFQVTTERGVDYIQNGIRVISADKFLSALV
ncbi:MAG: ATP-binding protein [Elusimicrobia bacterium]|nr:ATP-binding protein [Elusimicrobiota bacterium]